MEEMDTESLLDYEDGQETVDERIKGMNGEDEQLALQKLGVIEKPKAGEDDENRTENGHGLLAVEPAIVEIEEKGPVLLEAISWSSVCQGEEHSNCCRITLGKIFKDLPSNDPLRRLPISKLSEMICLHFASDVLHGQLREWAVKKDRDPMALLQFVSKPEKRLSGIEDVLAKWLNNCSNAYPALKSSKFRPINFEIPPGPLQKFGMEIAQAFENIRTVKIHGMHRTVRTPFVFVGDKLAEDLGNRCEAEVIRAENSIGLSDVLNKTAFGREVQEVILCVGTGDLDDNSPMEQCQMAVIKLLKHLEKFPIKIWVVPPPFHREKADKHGEYLKMLAISVPSKNLCLTKGFRSIVEVTMYGNQEEKRHVNERGQLKFTGVTATIRYLKEVFELEVPVKKILFNSGMETSKRRDYEAIQPQKFGRLNNAIPNPKGSKNFSESVPNHSRRLFPKAEENDRHNPHPFKRGRFI